MIIWGGYDNTFGRYLSDGARYNPATDSWLPVSAVGAPIMTAIHAAVWTGSRMLINSGASLYLYDPVADSWSNVTIPGLIPRANATAVWTGTEMIIWGGYDGSSNKLFGDGMRYNPVTDTWSPVSATNAPAPRTGHTVVWNGSEMLVWGGGVANSGTLYTDTGGIYTPATDSWTAMPATGGAPSARIDHAAVWTGSEMIVWGGRAMNSLDSGARYSPTAHSWQPVSAFCLPMARGGHTGTWSGTEMLVWGGADNPNGPYFEAGGRYNPAADTWQAIPVAGMPGPRMGHSGIWTGSELIVWGGYDNSGAGHTLQAYNNGGRYRPQ
jgi:N-acetylneuraminic acid mutarotase